MTHKSAGVFSVCIRFFEVPSTGRTFISFRWSHWAASLLHVASATFFGATTSTLPTFHCSRSSRIAVSVMTVLPSPQSRNKPILSSWIIRFTAYC